jgi:DNA-binding protein H-NS
MSHEPELEEEASKEVLKQSLRIAIEKMTLPEIAALIDFATQARQSKMASARNELLIEFQRRASEIGLSLESLVASGPVGQPGQPTAAKKLTAKYRGPNGEEWTGRGRPPRWLVSLETEGKKREQFVV